MPHASVLSMGSRRGRIKIAYEDSGSGIPIIFYPPLGNSKSIYDNLAEMLKDVARCIRIDPPGVGESESPSIGAYSVAAEVELLRGFLDALNIEAAVICGVSRGATVALQFALSHPERTLGVIAQGAVINSSDFARWEKAAFTRGRKWARLLPERLQRFRGLPITIGYALHVPLYKEVHVSELLLADVRAQAREQIRESKKSMAAVSAEATIAQLEDLLTNIDLQSQLPSLARPLLLMDGENVTGAAGGYKPIATFERIKGAVDDSLCTARILPGSGHLAMFVRSKQAARIIRKFLEQIQK